MSKPDQSQMNLIKLLHKLCTLCNCKQESGFNKHTINPMQWYHPHQPKHNLHMNGSLTQIGMRSNSMFRRQNKICLPFIQFVHFPVITNLQGSASMKDFVTSDFSKAFSSQGAP